jgi:hypothetical protein
MADRVNGANDTHIFTVHIQSRTNGHWVDCVVLSFNCLGLVKHTVHGDVKTVVVLWCKSEDTKRASVVAFGVFGVRIAEKALDGELTTLDPDRLCRVEVVENNRTAIGRRDNDPWVLGC